MGTAIHIAIGLMLAWRSGVLHDFHVFHASAVSWLSGGSPYIGQNLNPPVVVWVTSPIGFLQERTAWVLWQVLNGGAFATALHITTRDLPISREAILLCVLAQASTSAQTMLGQNAWLLALPLALAWQADRNQQPWLAGVWLGIVIAAKPFLIPIVGCGLLVPSWRRLGFSAGATAALVSAVMVPVFGVPEYRAWLALGSGVWQTAYQPTFASLSALLQQRGMVSPAFSVAATAPLWLMLVWRWPLMSPDRRWLGGLAAAILTSPLGWIHYGSWLLPLAVRRPRRWLWWAAMVAGAVPPLIVVGWPLFGPLYALSILLWWSDAVTSDAVALASGPGPSMVAGSSRIRELSRERATQ